MRPELLDLYQEIILAHNKRPRNQRALPGCAHRAKGHNPRCGDEVEVYVDLQGDRISDITFVGEGCAISRASASLMTETLKGRRVSEVPELRRLFDDLTKGDPSAPGKPVSEIGELAALQGLRRFPARYQCACLAWDALERAVR